MGLRDALEALLGVSAYQTRSAHGGDSLGDARVERVLETMHGQIAPLPQTQTRWQTSDPERALREADSGDLSRAARLMRSVYQDGTFAGVMSTRAGGLVRLPKRFRGDPELVSLLELGHDSPRSVFDEMLPPQELALLAADGIMLGVGVGWLMPVKGRDYPILVRLDPENLRYRWADNQWIFNSIAGPLPITPGDGSWVLHTPGGRIAPWQHGLWMAVGGAWIRKVHAAQHEDNWEGKLANPARVAVSPTGASDEQQESWFRRVMAWGVNTVFGLKPGWDVKLLESNGQGYKSFPMTMDRSDREMIIAVAGQVVTVDGGAGFANADIHKSIRADLIKQTADDLGYTVNTQVIPPFVLRRRNYDIEALRTSPVAEWIVDPPKDLAQAANALQAIGAAVQVLTDSCERHGLEFDARTTLERFGVSLTGRRIPIVRKDQGGPAEQNQ